jgi:predicted small lipoprotein YifL
MKRSVVGAAILAVLIGLVGCGQRGPLYLPKPPADRAADAQHPEPERR